MRLPLALRICIALVGCASPPAALPSNPDVDYYTSAAPEPRRDHHSRPATKHDRRNKDASQEAPSQDEEIDRRLDRIDNMLRWMKKRTDLPQ